MHIPDHLTAHSPHGVPIWFAALTWLVPAGILAQFLSAGLGLFLDPQLLGVHGAVGFSLSLPVIAAAASSAIVPRLRVFGRWTAVVLVLYLVQVGLAAGGAALPMALHPLNGALLLAGSLGLVASVERHRRSTAAAVGTP